MAAVSKDCARLWAVISTASVNSAAILDACGRLFKVADRLAVVSHSAGARIQIVQNSFLFSEEWHAEDLQVYVDTYDFGRIKFHCVSSDLNKRILLRVRPEI